MVNDRGKSKEEVPNASPAEEVQVIQHKDVKPTLTRIYDESEYFFYNARSLTPTPRDHTKEAQGGGISSGTVLRPSTAGTLPSSTGTVRVQAPTNEHPLASSAPQSFIISTPSPPDSGRFSFSRMMGRTLGGRKTTNSEPPQHPQEVDEFPIHPLLFAHHHHHHHVQSFPRSGRGRRSKELYDALNASKSGSQASKEVQEAAPQGENLFGELPGSHPVSARNLATPRSARNTPPQASSARSVGVAQQSNDRETPPVPSSTAPMLMGGNMDAPALFTPTGSARGQGEAMTTGDRSHPRMNNQMTTRSSARSMMSDTIITVRSSDFDMLAGYSSSTTAPGGANGGLNTPHSPEFNGSSGNNKAYVQKHAPAVANRWSFFGGSVKTESKESNKSVTMAAHADDLYTTPRTPTGKPPSTIFERRVVAETGVNHSDSSHGTMTFGEDVADNAGRRINGGTGGGGSVPSTVMSLVPQIDAVEPKQLEQRESYWGAPDRDGLMNLGEVAESSRQRHSARKHQSSWFQCMGCCLDRRSYE